MWWAIFKLPSRFFTPCRLSIETTTNHLILQTNSDHDISNIADYLV